MLSSCRSLSSHLRRFRTLLGILALISSLTIENGSMAHAFAFPFEKTRHVPVRLVARAGSNPCWPAASCATSSLHSREQNNDDKTKEEVVSIVTRRETWRQIALKSSSAVAGLVAAWPTGAALADETSADVLLRGIVTLQSESLWDKSNSRNDNAALYVTVRPSTVDNIPRAILDGTRGRPPPILAARFPLQELPMAYSLTLQDLTVEGREIWTFNPQQTMDARDWIVSARLDSDGVAATRDATDLVGRNYYTHTSFKTGLALTVDLELQGRGIGGKLFTGKQ